MNQKIASGITGASPIWYNIMYQLLKDKKYPDGIIDKPDNVVAVNIDALFGGLPKDNNPTRTEFFVKGTEPTDVSPYYKKLKISKSNGKIANDIEVRTGNYDEKDFYVVNENDPTSIDGTNLWQQAIDDWAKSQGDDKWHYPTETSDNSSDSVVVNTKTPQDRTTLNTNHVEIKAHITSESPIKNVKIYINGNELRSIDGDNKDIDESFDLSDGVYNLKITAWNDKNKSADSGTLFGVNKPWDSATPTPSPTPKP
jgi:hypothetical protein